jgi:hypothetical protein
MLLPHHPTPLVARVVAVVAVSDLSRDGCCMAWDSLWDDNYEGGRHDLPGPQFALRVTLQLYSAAVENQWS